MRWGQRENDRNNTGPGLTFVYKIKKSNVFMAIINFNDEGHKLKLNLKEGSVPCSLG